MLLECVEESLKSSIHVKLHHLNKYDDFIKMTQKSQTFTNPEDTETSDEEIDDTEILILKQFL